MQKNSSVSFAKKWVSLALFVVVASTIYISQNAIFNDVERSYAAALTSTNVQPASLVKSVTSTATVTFTTATAIPSNGNVKVTFPAGFDVTSVASGSGSCSTMDGTPTASVSGQVVTINLGPSSSQQAGGSAESCTIANVKNSASTGSTGTYTIETTNSSGTQLDIDSAVAADTIVDPDTLTSTNVEPASLIKSVTGTATISFTTVATVNNSFKIKVTFGAGYDLTGVGASSGACSTIDGIISTTISGQSVTLTRDNTGTNQAAAAETCTIASVKTSSSAGSTGTYQIQILDTLDVIRQEDTAVTADTITNPGTLTGTNVEPASLVAVARSVVTVSFTTVSAVGTNHKIKVTFPAGFNVADVNTGSCSTMDGGRTTSVSGQVVTLTRDGTGTSQAAAAESCTISGSVSNPKNPSASGSGGTYIIRITNASDEVLQEDTAVAADTFTPSLSSTNVQPASLVAGASGNVTVSFTTSGTQVNDNGKIRITFPSGFTINSGGTTAVSGGTGLQNGMTTANLVVSVSGQAITLTGNGGGTVAGIAASTAVSFTLSNMKNPIVSGSTGTYGLETLDSTSVVIDVDSAVAADTITAGALTSTNVEPASLAASASGNVTVTFTTANSIPLSGKIKITFGAGFNVVSASGGTCSSMDGFFATAVSGQVVTITRSAGTTQTAAAETCTLSNITNPSSAGSTGTYSITTTDGSDVTIDTDTAVTADTIVAVGALSSTNVAPATLVAGASGTATITFTTVNAIAATGKIKVTFGSGFNVSGASGGTCSTMDGSFATAVSGQVVTITRSAGTSQAAAAESCTIGSIVNPQVSGSTGTYTIQTTDSSDGAVDQDTAVAADTITVGALTSTNVEPASLVASASGNATVTFTMANPLPANGKVKVTFGAGFNVASASGGTCSTMDGGFSTSVSAQVVTITRNNAGTSEAAGAQTCTLSTITNSASTGTTGTYTITTTNTSDVSIDTDTAVAADTITSGSVGAITGVTIAVNHPYINAGAIYTFTFTTATALEGTDKIKFTFPSGYNIGSAKSGACTAMDGTVSTNASGTLTVVLQRSGGSSFASGQKVCTVSDIVNPSTIGTTGTFSIQTTSNADAVRDQNTSVAGISISAAAASTGSGGSIGVVYDPVPVAPAPVATHAAPVVPSAPTTASKPSPKLTPEPLPTPSVKKTAVPEEKTAQEPVLEPVKEAPAVERTGRELKQEARTIQKEISSLKSDYRKKLEDADTAAEKRKASRAYRLELHRLSQEQKEVQKTIREEVKEEKKKEIKEELEKIDHKPAKIEKEEEQEKLAKPEREAAPEAKIKEEKKPDEKAEKKRPEKEQREEQQKEAKVPEKKTVSEPKVIRIQPPSSKEAKAVRSRLQSLIRLRR